MISTSKKEEGKTLDKEDPFNVDDIREILLSSFSFKDESTKSNTLWTDEKGEQIVFKLFKILKDECDWIVDQRGMQEKNKFQKNVKTIYYNFFYKKCEDTDQIADVIKTKILTLKKDEYIIGIDDDSLDFITISLKEISNCFLKLRQRRLGFYNALVKDYLENKDRYDEVLKEKLKETKRKMTQSERRKIEKNHPH